MTAEDHILSACCTLHFGDEQRERIRIHSARAVDWNLIFHASVWHKVSPLVFQNLKACEGFVGPLPEEISRNFRQKTWRCGVQNLMVANNIGRVARHFHQSEHETLVLKHASYLLAHRQLFDLTMADDLDLAVRPVIEAAENPGSPYRWSSNAVPDATWAVIDNVTARLGPELRALHLEMDNRLHHDIVWNGVIPVDFRSVWRDATIHAVDAVTVRVPRWDDLIMISAVNIFRKPFIRLRNLVEIQEVIRLQTPFDWDGLARKARAYECGAIVYSALSAMRSTLGCTIDERDWKPLRAGPCRSVVVRLAAKNWSSPSTDVVAPNFMRRQNHLQRRLLALNLRQIGRFLWYRIVLRRIARVVKY